MDQTTETSIPETIALGEKEYTQEELQQAVGIAEQARELEEKWNTKIDRLMPAYSEATADRAEQARRIAELEAQVSAATAAKVQAGEALSPDEEAKIIKEQAKKYGLVTAEDFDTYYESRKEKEFQEAQARELISSTERYIDARAADGLPKIATRDLIDYMDENGISNPEAAYKIKYEKEIDDWKMRQLSNSRPTGLYTQTQSTAGAKSPEEVRVTSENLSNAIRDVMSRG